MAKNMTTKHRFPPIDERLLLQSVSRALDVLEVFSQDPEPKSLGEIAAAAGINKSAAQRISQTLLSRGYLEQAERGGLTLGRQFLDRSFDYLRANPLIEKAVPILNDLRKTTGERVDLSLFDAEHDNLSVVYALRMQSKRERFYATLAGRRMPSLVATGGRACLALLDDEVIHDIMAHADLKPITPKTRLEPERIWEKIREARRDGYAFQEEEALLGEVALAAAIRNHAGQPVGAVHIAGSLSEWSSEEFRKRFCPLAIEAARALSAWKSNI
ncbi:transcriptional regulator [Bordetella hinzii]|nr:Acetate operon repressor [Bordetella hinzii]KCB24087.1 transcriptional regulator, IclR family, C-terminal domain protein [Bordetella hinzii OH87 BAL007II]KCB28067.1 transcriptional regulator, IclR family, C-terminal domain protein [Bordetella hinzii CA90 BAL1384]KCB28682.1 transcriptional regulator, IclR family, C-terminal domain protein [Bordetella hinzii L60]KCB44511.1 transcriptional regulator, IclR family, C-terminal domain protein [Bordetella hinzii 4161]KCB45353.1 transcriptional regu